ncbi:hypothetical protein GCM10027347_57890 [Larkinella harenae]
MTLTPGKADPSLPTTLPLTRWFCADTDGANAPMNKAMNTMHLMTLQGRALLLPALAMKENQILLKFGFSGFFLSIVLHQLVVIEFNSEKVTKYSITTHP